MDFNNLEHTKRLTVAKQLRTIGVEYGYKVIIKKGQYGFKRKYTVLDITESHIREAILKVKALPKYRADKNGRVTYRGSSDQYTLNTLKSLLYGMSDRKVKADMYGNKTLQCSHKSCMRWRSLNCFDKKEGSKTGYDYYCNDCRKEDIRQEELFTHNSKIRTLGAKLNKELNYE